MTLSVFILSGSQLKAAVSLEGPLAGLEVDTGPDLHAKIIEYTNGEKPQNHLHFNEMVDFEHLNDLFPPEESVNERDDDDLVKQPILPDDPQADIKRMERRARQRKKFLDKKQQLEERKLSLLKRIRQDGEPFVHTAVAPVAGWYRVCVHSTSNQASMIFSTWVHTPAGRSRRQPPIRWQQQCPSVLARRMQTHTKCLPTIVHPYVARLLLKWK